MTDRRLGGATLAQHEGRAEHEKWMKYWKRSIQASVVTRSESYEKPVKMKMFH